MAFDPEKFKLKEKAKAAAGARRLARKQEKTKRLDRKATYKENVKEQRRKVRQTLSRGATTATMTGQYQSAQVEKSRNEAKLLNKISSTLNQYNKLITGDPDQDNGNSTSNPFAGWGE